MASGQVGYQLNYAPLNTDELDDDEETTDENDLVISEECIPIHNCAEGSKGNWNHIQDLDDFFSRVYNYHQRGGFICMALEDFFEVVQYVFIVLFAYFLGFCVSYPVLFHDVEYNVTHKVTLGEAILPVEQCLAGLNQWWVVLLFILFVVVGVIRLVRMMYNLSKYWYIRNFYVNALKISSRDLANKTWHEVQTRLLEVQKEHQMCIHKKELTQLDIYHRILRFHNYMVAMANVNLLPLNFNLPFVGQYSYFPFFLKFNLEYIIFKGIWGPFENNWHLRSEYKSARNKAQLTRSLEARIFWFGLANLIFCPIIFCWNILYFIFKYAEIAKRQPTIFGLRRWSNYALLQLRHFNELEHEFNARLRRGYQPLSNYLNTFTSTLGIIIAKNVRFIACAILVVIVGLTVYDEDVITVEHVLTLVTVLGVIAKVFNLLIPNEDCSLDGYTYDPQTGALYIVDSPEMMLRNVAMAIHYMPDNWAGFAHTTRVRDTLSTQFQFVCVYLVEEILSPIITPIILLFCVKPSAGRIVDFLRNFTVDVVGVGDICSYAQMEIRKHGNTKWQVQNIHTAQPTVPKNLQAENGKIEMSLIHFHFTNPEWKPDPEGNTFINNLKTQVHRDIQGYSVMTDNQRSMVNPSMMLPSLMPAQSIIGPYSSMISSLHGLPAAASPSMGASYSPQHLRGALSQVEGPVARPTTSLFGASLHSSLNSSAITTETASVHTSRHRMVDECTRELMTNEMSLNALLMHEMRWRRGNSAYLSFDEHARAMWRSPDSNTTGSLAATTPTTAHEVMPEIVEECSADDEREVDTSAASPSTSYHTGKTNL